MNNQNFVRPPMLLCAMGCDKCFNGLGTWPMFKTHSEPVKMLDIGAYKPTGDSPP